MASRSGRSAGRATAGSCSTSRTAARRTTPSWGCHWPALPSPYPYRQTEASENWAAFYPDGKWVAYSSTDTGTIEVYVSPFPSNGKRWRVSADGGSQARWRRDGSEIFYLAQDRTVIAASVTISGNEFTLNGYDPLFEIRHPYGACHAFDVTEDAKRFLVNTLVVHPGKPEVVA